MVIWPNATALFCLHLVTRLAIRESSHYGELTSCHGDDTIHGTDRRHCVLFDIRFMRPEAGAQSTLQESHPVRYDAHY